MSKLVNPPVPVDQAVDMTTHWRTYYGQITGTEPENALRAFKIPLEDIIALVEMAKKDLEINAVRAYLALGEPVPNGETLNPDKVHIILVPVADSSPAGKDILEIQRSGVTVSTIMDFTNPCPALCDFTSPLYGPTHD